MELPAVMIDGIHFQDRVVLLALGFDAQGKKHVLGLWEGTREKTAVVRALLSNLIERGLNPDTPRLWIIDGAKALRRAILEVFGAAALVHRCQEHRGAARSLREGLDETLTLIRLGVEDALYRTLSTTNPIENLNGRIAAHTRNVKRWRDGEMVLRWIAASLDEACRRFRAVRGYRDMKRLVAALATAVSTASDGKLKVA